MQKEKELEGRIKEHTREMQERRRKPKGTPQQEMEAARRELEVVSVYFFHSIPEYLSRRGKVPSLRVYIFPRVQLNIYNYNGKQPKYTVLRPFEIKTLILP